MQPIAAPQPEVIVREVGKEFTIYHDMFCDLEVMINYGIHAASPASLM